MSTFIFDPNDPSAFVDRWMEEVGNLYRGKKYNGWAMFNDQRELVDVYITDVDGDWVDAFTSPEDREHGAWDVLIDRARSVGATNILNVHTHAADEPSGPCDGMVEQFIPSCVLACATLSDGDIKFRGSVVLIGDEFDGILWVKATPVTPQQAMAQRLLPEITRMANQGNTDAQRVLGLVQRIAGGDRPPMHELAEAIAFLSERLDQPNIIVPPKPQIIDPLGLPVFDINDKRYMN